MGKCLTIIKLVGIGSLGIATFAVGSFIPAFQRFQDKKIERKPLIDLTAFVKYIIAGVGSLGSYMFYMAFTRSQAIEQHPYLIYSALTFPIALGVWHFQIKQKEIEFKSNSIKKTVMKKEKKIVKQLVPVSDEKSPLDDSYYGDLGNREPIFKDVEIEIDVPKTISFELDTESLIKLTNEIKLNYIYCFSIFGTGFLISIIGYLGEI